MGAMGFTWEAPLHRFVRRAHALDLLLGPWEHVAAELGRRLNAEGRVPRLVCAGFVVAALGSYVLYGAIDAWWSLRYVLPAFPFIFITATS